MVDNVIVEISIVPIGTGSTELSKYIAPCVSILENHKDLKYRLTSMGTIIEGPLARVLDVVKLMHEVPFEAGVSRVLTTIKIDDRRDTKASMDKKVESVLEIDPNIKAAKS